LNFRLNNELLTINLAAVVGGRKQISQQHKALNVSGNIMRLFTLTIALFLVTSSIAQNANDQIKFSVRFTKCFKNDTLSVKINDIQVFKNKIATTSQVDEVTSIYLFQNNNGLWVDTIAKLEKIKISRKILLDISINNHHEIFEVKLSKGKYILIDKCHGDGSFIGWRYLAVSQQKKSPVFD
jgi:hypothetical protein